MNSAFPNPSSSRLPLGWLENSGWSVRNGAEITPGDDLEQSGCKPESRNAPIS